MSDIFHEYMTKKLGEVDINNQITNPGPVITISRAAGCSSQHLAEELAKKLNEIVDGNTWEVISKEVLHESAQKLQLNPKQIKSIFKSKDHNFLEDIVHTFLSPDYQLEKKMKKTVIKVIHKFAVEGNKIILGRGGNIICHDIEKAMHIRIDAPLEWRIKRLMKTKKFNYEEALNFIKTIEKDRSNFRESIKGAKVEAEDFDIIINQSKFTNEEIIDIIVLALRFHKLI
jgi:cytidylate kinase